MPVYDTYMELLPIDQQSPQRGTYTYGYVKHIAVSGFQKLINQWAKCLLTLEGTNLSDREYGTQFTALIGSNITNRRDLQEAVQLAVAAANAKIKSYQAEDPPDDDREILDAAVLTTLFIDPDGAGFQCSVRIRNQAGEVLQVLLPGTDTGA